MHAAELADIVSGIIELCLEQFGLSYIDPKHEK